MSKSPVKPSNTNKSHTSKNQSKQPIDVRTYLSQARKNHAETSGENDSLSKSITTLENEIEQYKQNETTFQTRIESLTNEVSQLTHANVQLDGLLKETTLALKEILVKYQQEKSEKENLFEKLYEQQLLIEELQNQIIVNSSMIENSAVNDGSNTENIISPTMEDQAVNNPQENQVSDDHINDVDPETIQKLTLTQNRMNNSLKLITDSLCDKLLVLEQIIGDESLLKLMAKYKDKDDPYKSTAGWYSRQKRKGNHKSNEYKYLDVDETVEHNSHNNQTIDNVSVEDILDENVSLFASPSSRYFDATDSFDEDDEYEEGS